MDQKDVWISTLALVNQRVLKQPEHPGNSQNAMTVWTLSNHSQCCSLSLALRAGHYVDSPHSLTLWKWLIAQRGADTVVWWMADANHKFCCVVNPQSALLPQSCILGVIPSPVDFWKNIYYEEKIVLVGKSKRKKLSNLPNQCCCIVRFLEARSSHYGWSCDSPHWPSEQPCIVIDIGKVLAEGIVPCLNLVTTPLFGNIVKKNNILGLFFWDFVCHTILVFCWIPGFELKGCQTRDCKCQLLHDFSARERGLCGRTVRIITPAFVVQLNQTLLPMFNWSPNIQESESEMLRLLHCKHI